MAARTGAVHVATTKRTYKGKVYQTHLLRRTYRDGDRVRHQTLGNLSHLPSETIELVRASLKGQQFVPAGDAFEILRSLPHGHVVATLGVLRNTGLEEIISGTCPERRLVVAMIVARIIHPASKLSTARGLHEETAKSTLGQLLDIEGASEDELYAAMDWVGERQARIEAKLAAKHLRDGCLILYDVSSSYYTGTHCTLAKFGHPRDPAKGFPQIVYGLLCNVDGCPVAVEVFEGNTGDPKTLRSQIQKIRGRFGIERVVFVGDRGMITSARIKEDLRGVGGLDWITALRSPAIAKLCAAGLVQPSIFDDRDLAEISSPDYPGERLVVCRNPFLAEDRARKREALLRATEKLLEAVAAATRRKNRRLKGKGKINFRLGKIINRYKVGKHFKLKVSSRGFTYERDAERIAKEAALDGLYVIRSSVAKEVLGPDETVRAYKDLSKVERAFRCIKTVDLKIRPIHHWLEQRVRSHVFLCMLAYYVEWHMRLALAPILFEEDDRASADAARRSIVAPAERSESVRRKEATKRTPDDYPVQSFSDVLKDLGTITKNRVRPSGQNVEFYVVATPTRLQTRALELLGVRLGM
jgi:hypothetical protein